MVEQELARFIGTHAVEVLVVLLIVVLLAIVLLWRVFEAYHRRWWELISTLWRRITTLSFVAGLRQRYPRAWSFLGARLSPTNYLGLHLTLGLLMVLVALRLFTGLADEVVEQEELTQFDLALATTLHQHATPSQVAAFKAITELGNGSMLAALGVGVGLVLIIRWRWLLLVSWIITLGGGTLLNLLLKAIFHRTRPGLSNPFVVELGWSFPSGHAMGSLITYGMIAYLLVLVLNRHLRQVVIVGTVILVLLIGFSRLFLGAHYFSDVVAGYAAATIWLAVTISGTEIGRRRQLAQTLPPTTPMKVEINPQPPPKPDLYNSDSGSIVSDN